MALLGAVPGFDMVKLELQIGECATPKSQCATEKGFKRETKVYIPRQRA